jgi:FemAB-related protein (PEP-CTERM system-associated)
MRDHGTPVFPRAFLGELMKEFRERADILVISAKGEPLLGLLSFYFRDRVMPYYIGGRADARDRRAFDLALWLQLRRGAARGARLLDLGRSKYGTGSFAYKTHWGLEPKPLDYQYGLVRAREIPNVNPDNPKFAAAIAAWRRLPLPVANLAGPILARHIA